MPEPIPADGARIWTGPCPRIGFRLIQAIQALNSRARGTRKAEVVVASRNSPATSIRLFKSIEHHKLDIQRAILTSGTPVARYLKPFCVDLYLSAYESDVVLGYHKGGAEVRRDFTISMNHTLDHGGYKVYQTIVPLRNVLWGNV